MCVQPLISTARGATFKLTGKPKEPFRSRAVHFKIGSTPNSVLFGGGKGRGKEGGGGWGGSPRDFVSNPIFK